MSRNIGLLCLALSFVLYAIPSSSVADFEVRRGVNVSHWLSQSSRRAQERKEFFTEKDVERIASFGYDHIRLPVDEEQLWDESGNQHADAFALLHDGIRWARAQGLRVVVDLHILRSHHFNAEEKPLFTDPAAQERFFQLWRELSAELRKYPTDEVAYELMNEPVADTAEDWNRLVEKAVAVVREHEPKRTIVIGSNRWQSYNTMDELRIPEGDRYILLSFHFYHPMLVTHYQASWTGVGRYDGPIDYPGRLVSQDTIEQLPEEMAKLAHRYNGVYNREVFEKMLAEPLAVAEKYDLPLYCGEWGCIKKAPRDVRLAWYRDVRGALEAHDIAWANWDYKGGFGVVERDGGESDQELIDVLLPENE